MQVYETLLYLLTPFVLPISFLVRPAFCGTLLAVTVGLYLVNVLIFNEVHLRRKKERVDTTVLLLYYVSVQSPPHTRPRQPAHSLRRCRTKSFSPS